jgi:hypothetical protein
MSAARLGRLLLVLALLAGWQAALEHPIKHVDESGAFVHRHDGHSRDGGSGDSAPGTLCDAFAALTACAPDAACPLVASAPAQSLVKQSGERAPRAAEAPPFLSQGPPASA